MSAASWHEDENAVYEVDYECMKKSGKLLSFSSSLDNRYLEENFVLSYFVLLLCLFFA